MKLTYSNIYKEQIKSILKDLENKAFMKGLKIEYQINDNNPIDEYFDIVVNNEKVYLFLKRNLGKFV